MDVSVSSNNQTSNVGGHFALKLAQKCEILIFYIALLKISSAFEISMTI
jgi:hypothetical protein